MRGGWRKDCLRAALSMNSTRGRARSVGKVFTSVAALLTSLLFSAEATCQERVTYYYTDNVGTVLATTDSTGATLSSTDYRPFGVTALGAPSNSPGFGGHVNDQDTSLIYMQQRYYDPDVGRFISTDKIAPGPGRIASFNRFDYANNNPITFFDDNGEYAKVAVAGNVVSIEYPVKFTGDLSHGEVQAYTAAIQSAYTGQFGRYSVSLTVTTPAPGTPRSQYNLVEVGPLDPKVAHGRPFANAIAGDYVKLGPLTGNSAQQAYYRWSFSHEGGHTMGLPDMYTNAGPVNGYGSDMMGASGQSPSEEDISNIIYFMTNGYDVGHGTYPSPSTDQLGENFKPLNGPCGSMDCRTGRREISNE